MAADVAVKAVPTAETLPLGRKSRGFEVGREQAVGVLGTQRGHVEVARVTEPTFCQLHVGEGKFVGIERRLRPGRHRYAGRSRDGRK